MTHNVFDARPDPTLGAALRSALEPRDQAAFVARAVARFDQARGGWTLLAGWARRGIAAAAVAVVVVGVLVERTERSARAEATVAAATDPAAALPETAWLVAEGPPEPGALFAPLLDPLP